MNVLVCIHALLEYTYIRNSKYVPAEYEYNNLFVFIGNGHLRKIKGETCQTNISVIYSHLPFQQQFES